MDLSPLVREVKEYLSIRKVLRQYMDEYDRPHWLEKRRKAEEKILKKARELVEREKER